MLFDTIRYPWAYKHVGVIRLFDETGRLHPDVDIYNNFSGFFGLAAFVRGATGIDPTSYAAWTQFVAEALILAAVVAARPSRHRQRTSRSPRRRDPPDHQLGRAELLRRPDPRHVAEPRRAGPVGELVPRRRYTSLPLFRIVDRSPGARHGPARRPARPVRRAVVLLGFLGLMMTHPLTPVATARRARCDVGRRVATRRKAGRRNRCRSPRLGTAVVRLLRLPGVRPGFRRITDGERQRQPRLQRRARRCGRRRQHHPVVLGGVWLLAIVGAILCAWAMRRTACCSSRPASRSGFRSCSPYGGEAIYRVYLVLAPADRRVRRLGHHYSDTDRSAGDRPQPMMLASVICLLLGAGFLVAHFGREQINTVDPSEVAMGEYIAATVPILRCSRQFAGTYPAASTPGTRRSRSTTPTSPRSSTSSRHRGVGRPLPSSTRPPTTSGRSTPACHTSSSAPG